MEQLHLVSGTTGHQIYVVENLTINYWHKPPTLRAYDMLEAILRERSQRYAYGNALANVFTSWDTARTRLAPEVRDRIVALARNPAIPMRAVAQIIVTSGLLANLIGMAVSTLMLLTKRATPVQVFKSTSVAAQWLFSYMPKERGAPVWNAPLIDNMLKAVIAQTASMHNAHPRSSENRV